MSKQPRGHGKTDVRYWREAVFQPSYTRNGARCKVDQYAVKLQFAGRRETIPLGTANRENAAQKAREIHFYLQSNGWDETLLKFKPRSRWSNSAATTVGEFCEQVQSVWSGKAKTLGDYIRAFRTMVSDIFEIDGGTSKFDYRAGGRESWLEKVDRIRLREIASDRVQKWKVDFLRRAGTNPAKRRSASISVNSLLRQAKSLFAPRILKFVKLDISASPFEGVEFEPRRSMRYQGGFDVKKLIRAAQEELPREQFKIFLLALMAGLRRNEIDKLEWSAFDWRKGIISIKATSYFTPKSEDSTGDVEVDPEVMDLFRGYKASKSSDFVIEGGVSPRPDAAYSHYRCQRDFEALNEWLRAHDVEKGRPLHTLRKEYGSQVCAKHGIYAASRALRHADIAITSQHYLDKRQRATVGLGALLVPPKNIISIEKAKATIGAR
ncbi:MAG TPA: tyrosine-type recombinase/integrase [Chthoniobacterales bacterium]|nr:tyrosine-type recombinase/integrase [Chthoniobacterales bacterium]